MKAEFKILMITVNRENTADLESALREKQAHFRYTFNATGTAGAELLKPLGLSGTEKTVCLCLVTAASANALMSSVAERMSLTKPGKGLIYMVSVSGISAAAANLFGEETKGEDESFMEIPTGAETEATGYSLVVAVINQGFSETLMGEARAAGARGGTIIHGRRSAVEDEVKFFGMALQKEKEIVTILVSGEQKNEIVRVITAKCGLNTKARGIIFSVPVEKCFGIREDEATRSEGGTKY